MAAGSAASVLVEPGVPAYYTIDTTGLTTGAAKSGSHVQMERALGSKVLRVYGSIAVDAQPDVEEVAIHDPAEYAAMALKGMLEARGIVVTGVARAAHRMMVEGQGFLLQSKQPLPNFDLNGSAGRGLVKSLSSLRCWNCAGLMPYRGR